MGEVTPTDRLLSKTLNIALLTMLHTHVALRRTARRVERMKSYGRGVPCIGYVAPRGAMKNPSYLRRKGLI